MSWHILMNSHRIRMRFIANYVYTCDEFVWVKPPKHRHNDSDMTQIIKIYNTKLY